jgi:hypothetical protein
MERELIGRNLSVWDDNGEPLQTIKEVEVSLKPETIDIIRANKMVKQKQIVGYEIPVKMVTSKLESRLRYRILADYKRGITPILPSITGKLTDKATGSVERIIIRGVAITGDVDLIIAKIDENKGIDITLEGSATDFDFLDRFPEYLA